MVSLVTLKNLCPLFIGCSMGQASCLAWLIAQSEPCFQWANGLWACIEAYQHSWVEGDNTRLMDWWTPAVVMGHYGCDKANPMLDNESMGSRPPCYSALFIVGWLQCIIDDLGQDSLDCSNGTDSRFVPSQWEIALLCNDISHWLGWSFLH